MQVIPHRKASILIADDEPHIRDVLDELLSDRYECVKVGSAEEALECLQKRRFDLVLSDIVMGGLSGLEMIPHVLRLSPETVVIMISGEQTIESAIRAMRAGAFDYITKPFDLQHVEAAVKRALDHQELLSVKRYYEQYLEKLVEERTAELDRTTQTLRALVQASPLAILALSPEGEVKMWNRAAERIFGWTEQEVLGRPLPIIPPDRNDKFRSVIESTLQDKTINEYETQCCKRDGSAIDVSIWTAVLPGINADTAGAMAIIADITERKQAEAQIFYLAYHDTLTELPNRTLFEDRLRQALTQAQRSRRRLAVLFLALDRFKKFNDTLGHAMGDRLLRDVAQRLVSCVREGDTVARFGSDEFSLLLTQINGAEDAAGTARNIQELLKTPFRLDGHELYVTASIGIGLSPDDGDEAQLLLKNTGAALYRAKRQGGNNYQFYTADMNARAMMRLSLETNLRNALDRAEFAVYYQPQVSIDTGKIVGLEALMRWCHPTLGLVSPAEFIPLAEDTGLIVPLGEWVLRCACAQSKTWQEGGLAPLRVAVNLSPRQFRQTDLVKMVRSVLDETRLDPHYLELELTEGSIMENAEYAIATLHQLKEMGVTISIDDFGSGYSSLSHLKRFPLDMLKIDQSFVRDTTIDPNDAAIVMAIITLAHSLKLKVIAEGVENEDQLRFLRLLRCDEIQGYLFSKPVPAEEMRKMLETGRQLNLRAVAPSALA
jgi:diguanylate cyclase (GGDEF)-like protein/PAS domain S-box-containing protein